MGWIRRSWLSVVLAGVLVASSYGCATGGTQEEECRRARGRAVGKAFGALTVGVLLLAVFVVAAAGGGSSSGSVGSSGRRRRDRARRRGLSVCRDAPAPMERTVPVAPPPDAPVPPAPRIDPGPPSRDDLQAGFNHLEPQLRQCVAATTRGTLYIDANIAGGRGHVESFTIDGEPAVHADTTCLSRALAQLRYPVFGGTVRVRWALPVGRNTQK